MYILILGFLVASCACISGKVSVRYVGEGCDYSGPYSSIETIYTIGATLDGSCQPGLDGYVRVDCNLTHAVWREFVDEVDCLSNNDIDVTEEESYWLAPVCVDTDGPNSNEYFCDVTIPSDYLLAASLYVMDSGCSTGLKYISMWSYQCIMTQNGFMSFGVTDSGDTVKFWNHGVNDNLCLPSSRNAATETEGTLGECSADLGEMIIQSGFYLNVEELASGGDNCPPGTEGVDCTICTCQDVDSTNRAGCSGNGECVSTDVCVCDSEEFDPEDFCAGDDDDDDGDDEDGSILGFALCSLLF